MVSAGLVLCVHTDVSLAHCSCRSRTVNQVLHPAAAPQFESEAGGGLPASPLESLYKGITIIRCLINPTLPPPRHCNLLRARYSDSLAPVLGDRERRCRRLRRDPWYNSPGCNLPPGSPGLRNWNPPNPRQREFSRCV